MAHAHVLAFADDDRFGGAARAVLDALAPALPDVEVAVDAAPDARPEGRLICAGIGAGARRALLTGRRWGADAILAWAPSTSGSAPDDETLVAAYADRALDRADQSIHLLTVADTAERDLALIRRLAGPSLGIRIARNDALIAPALSILSRQTGALAHALRAVVAGEAPPKEHDLADRWRQGFAHRVVLDAGAAWRDAAGALHLPGTFHWDGDAALDLAGLAAEHVLIGLRIGLPGDAPARIGSARAAFGRHALAPGGTLPFTLAIAPPLVARGGQIEVGLVAERSFWFDAHGFACARLWLDAAGGSA